MVAPFFFSDGRISDTVSWMFHPRLYKTHPPTGRCSAGSAPRKRPFPAFSGTYPHLLCLLYYSGICRHFQVTMKFISGCFYTRLWSQSSFLLSAPGVVTMTFSGVVSRNTSPTTSLPSTVTSLNATGTTLGAPLAQVARSHIPAFSSFATFSFSITASSLLFEPCGPFVVLIIGAIQGYEKIWVGL